MPAPFTNQLLGYSLLPYSVTRTMSLKGQRHFYLNALEDIVAAFSPLTLYHSLLLKEINSLKQMPSFPEQWESFHTTDILNESIPIDPSVLQVLEKLHWLAEFILSSVGESTAERKLSFCLTQFRQVQLCLSSYKPFYSIAVEHQTKITDSILLQCLQVFFGPMQFKPLQLEAIKAALEQKDVLCLFPTGFGKSLVFQLISSIEYGVAVVVSPLCSLIADQLRILKLLGIECLWLRTGIPVSEEDAILMALNKTVVYPKIVFLTPEKYLCSYKVQSTLNTLHRRQLLKRFILDEVHCLSQWGRSFRPSYFQLTSLRERFATVPFLALTATATTATILDIKTILRMPECLQFRHSFNRHNLSLNVLVKRHTVIKDIAKLLKYQLNSVPGIIYCRTRKECEYVSKVLEKEGLHSLVYHSKVSEKRKDAALDLWVGDKVSIIVATIAFGLG